MNIEEAIVYAIVSTGHKMSVDRIVDTINRRRLHVRKDGKPVSIQQVYAVIMHRQDIFVKEEGGIRLMY